MLSENLLLSPGRGETMKSITMQMYLADFKAAAAEGLLFGNSPSELTTLPRQRYRH